MGWVEIAAAAAIPLCASAQCPDAEILAPRRGSLQAEARPTIVWRPAAEGTQYRVQIESRVPNGSVLQRIDTTVAQSQFTPSQPLADERAVVKVRVTPVCPGETAATVAEMPPLFQVDVRALCPAPGEPTVRAAAPMAVQWKPAPGAKTEVSVFAAADGKLLLKDEVTGNRRDLPSASEPFVVALRSRCREATSEPVYRVVASPTR